MFINQPQNGLEQQSRSITPSLSSSLLLQQIFYCVLISAFYSSNFNASCPYLFIRRQPSTMGVVYLTLPLGNGKGFIFCMTSLFPFVLLS